MRGWKRWMILGAAAGVTAVLALTGPGAAPSQSARPDSQPKRDEASALTPRVTPAMVRYSYTRYALYFAGVALELVVLWLFLRTRASALLRDGAEQRTRRPWLQTLLYFAGFFVIFSALLFPLTFYRGYWLPHQYGLSDQSLPAWLWDRTKESAVSFALTAPLMLALYALIRRQPGRWWFSFWLLSIPVTVLMVLVAPVVLDPIFHNYKPLQDTALRDRILALASEAGIEGGRVYQVDMSRETKTLNAYVTGLGATKRIVLWDTTLERLEPDEILFIMGHEMAHYVYNHVYWGTGLSISGSLLLFFLLDRLTRGSLARRGEEWGVRGLGDVASLPALAAVLTLLQFLGMPVMGAISRTMESQADRFGLQITEDGHAAARAFVKLSEGNLSLPSPPPFIRFWLASHPTLKERIDMSLEWERQRNIRRPEGE